MPSFTQWLLSDVVPAFSRTLLHSLWQGVATAIVAGIIIKTTRKSAASMRYNALMAMYVLFVITVCATFFREMNTPRLAAKHTTYNAAQVQSVVIAKTETTANTVLKQAFGERLLDLANRNALLLTGLWALLFLIQFSRMALGMHYVKSIKRRGRQSLNTEWSDWIMKTSKGLGIQKAVALLESEKLKVPVTLGFFKPVILIPIGLLSNLNPQQVEAVLLHELAHIRRNDYLVNLVQSFADALFFFNPAVQWISSRIRDERETCCDNAAVQQSGNKKEYIEALVTFSQLSLSSYAMAIGGNKTPLLNRVKTILTRENSKLTNREQTVLLLGTTAMVAFVAFAFTPKERVFEKQSRKPTQAVVNTTTRAAFKQPRLADKTVALYWQRKPIDTVPQPTKRAGVPVRWKTLSTNSIDDGAGRTTQVLATAEDGTVYRVRKTEDEVVLFSINGREVAKSDYPTYRAVMDAIEQTVDERRAEALKEQEQRRVALQQEHALLVQKQALMAEQRKADLLQEQQRLQSEQAMLGEKRALELQERKAQLNRELAVRSADRLRAVHDRQRDAVRKMDLYEQKRKEYSRVHEAYQSKLDDYKAKTDAFYTEGARASRNPAITGILSDLAAAGLVDNEDRLSFSLNNNDLIVNGKSVDKALFEKLRVKYLKKKGDSYRYAKDGNTTSTTISLE